MAKEKKVEERKVVIEEKKNETLIPPQTEAVVNPETGFVEIKSKSKVYEQK